MSTHEQRMRRGSWSELLLGGAAAGVGAPFLLGGLRRFLHLRQGGSPASVGWTAGLLGALVAGGLARRRLQDAPGQKAGAPAEPLLEAPARPELPDASSLEGTEEDADEPMADRRREARRRRRLAVLAPRAPTQPEASGHEVPRTAEWRPRRGPSGREQPWHEALASTPG
ncbi:hypothetical protein [Pyxidicoccus trucidator]|uniref:hypothetical protein n=1 Tax=Pyxidicoccus trucidator TaxID=2709662 RepID=UPI0013D9DD5B|nr:hypothetical protein [Pyxidicoccus trucidator]